jgi:nicotinate phosphoribosyltransferase
MASMDKTSTGIVAKKRNCDGESKIAPLNPLVTPLLNDMYQITMAYSYWRSGRQNERATFELFFRKCPFKGEFVVFCGMDQVMNYLKEFKFTQSDVDYLARMPGLAGCDPGFFEYLLTLDCSEMVVSALEDGTVAFPRVTLISVSGPLVVGQLLETTLLNLINYPSLIATNAARMRLAAGPNKTLLEFGLRRAQGPDGGVSASRYAYVGGFDGTSNVRAGHLTNIPVSGTHAHSFVQSYQSWDDIKDHMMKPKDGGAPIDVVARVKEIRATQEKWDITNTSELAAFLGYAQSFPNVFLALVDTYDTLQSGVENFIMVSLVLIELGYTPRGIRLDSGDLAYLSKEARSMIDKAADQHNCPILKKTIIVASNDINEGVLLSLNNEGHAIDAFGIGTHLVTCQAQPALGCVYKLVEIEGAPRIKLSQDIEKVMIPGEKDIYRIFNTEGQPLIDLICRKGEEPPSPGKRVLCRHPFTESKRANVNPTRVQKLLSVVWDGPKGFSITAKTPDETRDYAITQLALMRTDMTRPHNPTPYKVSVTNSLYMFLHELWQSNMPIHELS